MSDEPDEPAPIGTWRALYAFVLGLFVLEVVLFHWIGRSFG